VGRRSRQRAAKAGGAGDKLVAPESSYPGDAGTLVLRGSMTPATRRQYAEVRAGKGGAQTSEDAWQRAVEFLYERLVVRWESSGVVYEGQKQLLQRFRAATRDERQWVRDVLRAHCAEWFPDVEAP
jgi:hypothetical protein